MELGGLVRPRSIRGAELFSPFSEFISQTIDGERCYLVVEGDTLHVSARLHSGQVTDRDLHVRHNVILRSDDILNRLWQFDDGVSHHGMAKATLNKLLAGSRYGLTITPYLERPASPPFFAYP
ncbi:hypothetical protein [Alcanivorax sp. DG881]|uniref:hypothetical protein n=1 Tax=Alcanivorax sp. DG881 TaxID=236097 RepID=UPI00058719B7|nr:hypothetical protein [Alcanivorax sp. DG881]